MSNFLNVTDRIPTLPNRKKITHADSSVEYVTMEYADEPLVDGTIINKSLFDKIEPVGSTLKYNIPDVEQIQSGSGYIRNLIVPDYARPKETFDRCLIATNRGTTFEKISTNKTIALNVGTRNASLNKILNNKYFLTYNNLGKATLDSNRNLETQSYLSNTNNYSKSVKLANGNILIVYGEYTQYTVFSVMDSTMTSEIYHKEIYDTAPTDLYVQALSDNRALIFRTKGSSSSKTLFLYELNANNDDIRTITTYHSGTYWYGGSACLLPNNDVAICYATKDGSYYYVYVIVYDNTLTTKKYDTRYISTDAAAYTCREPHVQCDSNKLYIAFANGGNSPKGALTICNFDLSNYQIYYTTFNAGAHYADLVVGSSTIYLFYTYSGYLYYFTFDKSTETFSSDKTLLSTKYDTNNGTITLINQWDGSYTLCTTKTDTSHDLDTFIITPDNPNAVLPPYSTGADQINGIDSTTIFANDKVYEMVYNAVDNKWHELSSKEVIW